MGSRARSAGWGRSPPQAMRALITGMGGELGTRVANLLEADPSVEAVVGVDVDPPRRRIHRAEFHRIDTRDGRRIADLVRTVEPTVVVHLGVYEPNARSGPAVAAARTEAAATAVLEAAADCGSVERIVVRSGIEVYGRGRNAPTRPDEDALPVPTSPFGRSLLGVEHVAWSTGIPVTALRCAPIVGSHLASPLGRYLRLPAVPVSVWSDLPFSVLHLDDAAGAIVAAVRAGFDGPLNVVGGGAVTPFQAVRLGHRIPVPIGGPAWALARIASEVLGAPLPDHVHELLVRGRVADGGLAAGALGIAPARASREVVEELFEWAPVEFIPAAA